MSKQKTRIFVGIPHTGFIRAELAVWLIKYSKVIFQYYIRLGKPTDANENAIVKEFLKSNCTHLLLIDQDIKPYDNLLKQLLKRDVDLVSAAVPTFDSKRGGMVIAAWKKNDNAWSTPELSGKLEEIDFISPACTLIKRHVLEKLEPPYFKIELDKEGLMLKGADLHFSEKVKEKGFKMYVDLTEMVGHKMLVDYRDLLG